MVEAIPLQFLAVGRAAVIEQIVGEPAHVHRLDEMGLRGGVRIEVVQSGRPCIVRIGRQRLCFRDSELMGVLVRPEGTSRPPQARAS